jgi:hypothetical protein
MKKVTIKKICGALMIASIFIAIFIAIAIQDGLLKACITFGLTALLVVFLLFAVDLMTSEK